MTSPNIVSERRRRVGAWVPRIALAVFPATWITLAATLPTAANRDLTIDVSCTSGNPVVAIWIESRSGGSWFAQEGEPGHTKVKRYTYRQKFTEKYQVRVGCGGTQQQWGITVMSSYSDRSYRRLLCDDVNITHTAHDGCRDELT